MNILITFLVLIILAVVVAAILIIRLQYKEIKKYIEEAKKSNNETTMIDLGQVIDGINQHAEAVRKFNDNLNEFGVKLPKTVLNTIQGSINPRKGKLGELITLMQLTSEYDRIIPLAKPVDFIGINKDSIDFIEVKVDGSRLTEEEKIIKGLIEANKVRFVIVRKCVEIDNLNDVMDFDGNETEEQTANG